MDQERFDDLAKIFAEGSDRRSVIRRLAGGVLGSVAALGVVGAEARRKKRRRPRVTCVAVGLPCGVGVTKPCCTGLSCVNDVCVTSTSPPPPPPPPTCGGKCNPKDKRSCGDPNTCECVGIADDSGFGQPIRFHYECRTVETCRPTYHNCIVGAPKESRFDCCNASDYCKPVRTGDKKGFCKPRDTCPVGKFAIVGCPGATVLVHTGTDRGFTGRPCVASGSNATPKGCFCRFTYNEKEPWVCAFWERGPKDPVPAPEDDD